MEPYQPKLTPTPTGTLTPETSLVLTPTPSFTATPVTGQAGTTTPTVHSQGPKGQAKTVASVGGAWTMNGDDLEWEIGTVAASETKNVTILLQDKKDGKKEYPVVLKAVLKSKDKVIAEAAPVTLQKSDPALSEGASPKGAFTPAWGTKSNTDDVQSESVSPHDRLTVTPTGH
jgi:hypothetical protein